MQLQKIQCYKSSKPPSLLPNSSPPYYNYLQQSGINKLKSSITYHKYLNNLRNIQNQLILVNKIPKQQLINIKSNHHSSNQYHQDIFLSHNQQYQINNHQQLIHGTSQLNQNQLTQNIITISENIDKYLQKGLDFTNITCKKQNNITKTNKINIQTIKNKYHTSLLPKNDTQISQNDITSINKQNSTIKYQKQLKWGKQGLELDIINTMLKDKINIISKGSSQGEKNNYGKFKKSKNKLTGSSSTVKIRDDSLTLSEGCSNNHPKQDKNHLKIASKYKQNTLPLSQHTNTQQNTSMVKNKKLQIPQNDLLTIFQNYQQKRKYFGINQKYMTEKRQQAIFTNQFMKVARKYDSLDILSSLFNNKPVQVKTHSHSIHKKQQKDDQIKKIFSIPASGLRQLYKKQFAEISRITTQKL